MSASKVVFENKEFNNERLLITDKDSLYVFRSNVILRGCALVMRVSARNLIIHEKTRFIDCTFEVNQELKNYQAWVRASLTGCRFKGRLSSCDFGHWPDYGTGCEHGFIEDCDFTEARLDGCRFMGCDPTTLRFPKWPCFTILDPIGQASRLRKAQWPDLFGRLVIDDLHQRPPPTRALTYFAPAMAKRCETTPEALKALDGELRAT